MQSPLLQLALSSPSLAGDAPLHEWTEGNVLVVPGEFNSERSLLPVDGSIVLVFRVPTANKVPWITGVDVLPVDGSGEWRVRYRVDDLIVDRRAPGSPTFQPLPNEMKYGFWEILSTASATSSAPVSGAAPLSHVMRIWGDCRASSCATSVVWSAPAPSPGSMVSSICLPPGPAARTS
jgi:hypothetical protein